MATPTMTLTQLKRSRTSRQTIIDKLIVELKTAIQDKDVLEIERLLTQLELKEVVLIGIAQQIETLITDEDDLDLAINENNDYAEKIVNIKILAHRMLAEIRKASYSPTSATTVLSGTTSNPKVSVKLPKLQIRKFDGSIHDWERFYDQFKAGVDDNVSLSEIDKFNYLKGFLTENASLTIAGLALTSANYAIAKDLLLKKYGQSDVLVAEHVRQLLEIRKITKIDNGQELRAHMENFQIHLRALENLGKSVMSMGALLCPTLLKSLPHTMIREWHRKTLGLANDNLMLMLDFVKSEIEGIELACRNAASAPSTVKDVKKAQRQENQVTSASTLFTAGESSQTKKKRPCVFCSSFNHFSQKCTEYKTGDERANALRKQNRCFRCLQKNHTIKACDKTNRCFHCQNVHHSLICNRNFNRFKNPDRGQHLPEETVSKFVAPTETSPNASNALIASAIGKSPGKSVSVLQTLRVWLRHAGGLQQIVLLLDGGSERTFIRQQLVQQLKLPCQQAETLTVHSFGGQKRTQQSKRIPLTLVSQNEFTIDISALEVAEICSGVALWESSQIEAYLQSHKQRFNWKQAMGPGENVTIDVLVGADYYWKLVTGHMKRLTPLLMATETHFGWTLQGNAGESDNNQIAVTMFVATDEQSDVSLNNKLSELWELDRTGVMSLEEQSTRTLQDEDVLQQFQDTTTFSEGRYQVNIPWNSEKAQLCNNYNLAKHRLKGLLMKLQKDKSLLERYRQGIYEYLRNQHTEDVTLDDVTAPTYYMPHHPIVKDDRKTTKLRIVFDASSHDNTGKSLNQCQFTGPNLNPTIWDLLLRFRWHKIGVTSDVEKAFLQVSLKREERDATRFLWTDEEWTEENEPKLKIFRMTRVLFGMKASPYLLASTIRFHVKQYAPEYPIVSQLIDNNTYVDDYLVGAEDTDQALFISTRSKQLMDKASMPLKKWATNDPTLRQLWKERDLISEEEPIELLKVLGLMWDPATDLLSFKTTELFKALKTSRPTKRSILEMLARIFDPLGILSPKQVTLKLLLQDLWRLKLQWDDVIPESCTSIWENWKQDLHLLLDFQQERWYQTSSQSIHKCQLHVFCDASLRAYGTVAYLRLAVTETQFQVTFIGSKARISPLKLMSIPRLEILACVLGARLAHSIKEAWSQQSLPTYFWTDSQVALQWISTPPSRWKLFIARRVQEIQDLSNQASWNYCTSKDNPADILSRGQNLQKLIKNELWWKGPKWLSFLTEFKFHIPETKIEDLDCIKQEENVLLLVVIEEPKIDIFDPLKFSKWQKIVRITAWIIRFLQNCRKLHLKKEKFLFIQEIKNAELYWIQRIQASSFPAEIDCLKNNKDLEKTSPLLQFQPFLDRAGTMRVSGRLQQSHFSTQQKHPILLKGGGILDYLILDRHEKTLHGGVQSTLLKLREDVWILKGRQVVRKAINSCRTCKKWTAKPADVTEAPLPEARITRSLPFEVTGLDFCGPIWTKVAEQKTKSYVCLFTCAVTRGVHLELTQSQNIKHFLWAFRRFIARRGAVRIIYSDNAATFASADRLLQESLLNLKHEGIQDTSIQHEIEWRYIMPRASWWGGFYERIVGTIKRHLRRTLGAALMSPEELATLLIDIEAVINARPLLALSDDARDSSPLTPSHFLIGQKGGPLTDILPSLNTVPVKPALLKRWQYRKRLMDNYWKQWSKEYLLQLQSAHKMAVPANQTIVQVGDVVLLREEKLPRGKWKIARVEEIFEGRDGKIRSALLRTALGTPLRRAIQHLCPLEVI